MASDRLLSPHFLEGKETNYAFQDTLLAHQRGKHRTNWIFKLAYFFITRPKQTKQKVTDLNEGREMKIKVSMELK